MGNADELLERILNSGPSQGTLHVVLSKLKEEGRHRELIRHALKALSLHPDDIVIRGLLAESYLRTGLLGQAESELEKVAAGLAPLMSAYKLQAEIYARQNRYPEASGALSRFLAHHTDDRDALALLEKVRSSQMPAAAETGHDMEEAPLPEYRDAPSELAMSTLAEIYYSQGRVRDAIQTYEEVLRQNPFNRVAAERLTELTVMTSTHAKAPAPARDEIRARKEKMIGVLDNWLAKIRELEHR